MSQLVNELIESCLDKNLKTIKENIEIKYLDRKKFAKKLLLASDEDKFQQALIDLKRKFKPKSNKAVKIES